jgi:hypothetical protein
MAYTEPRRTATIKPDLKRKKVDSLLPSFIMIQMHSLSQKAIVRSSVLNLNSNEFKGKSYS